MPSPAPVITMGPITITEPIPDPLPPGPVPSPCPALPKELSVSFFDSEAGFAGLAGAWLSKLCDSIGWLAELSLLPVVSKNALLRLEPTSLMLN